MEKVKDFSQAYTQAPWRRQVQMLVVFLVLLVLGATVAAVYLNVSAEAVAMGHDVQIMQDDIDQLSRANADLETKLAYLTSEQTMKERADKMGFEPVQSDQIMYLKVQGYYSRQPINLAPASGPVLVKTTKLPPEYSESLVTWFKVNVVVPASLLAKVLP
ncbi:MAG: hypothetical protein ACM3PY_01605 [Omnitrophica WOR_2 bacterium]